MKIIKCLSVIAIITGLILLDSCKESFLDVTPNGALDETVLPTYDGVDGLLISAYSMMDGVTQYFQGFTGNPQYDGWETTTSGWVFSSIRGMEANKGSDAGDQPYINEFMMYNETPENVYLNLKWKTDYESVARCNSVIKFAKIAEQDGAITSDEATSFIRQARTLRGFYHFEAFRMWGNMNTGTGIPYLDENTDWETVTNNVDIRDKIIEDLNQGTSLPNDMKQTGRFNKSVSQVLLAKAYMQLYRDYDAALPLLTEVANSGTNPAGKAVGLETYYGNIFDIIYRNGTEAVYTVQYSVNDGSGGWNAKGEVLNYPYKGGSSPGGCCGFFQPTQEFVNSFRTVGGLPLLDYSYNTAAEEILRDQGIPAGGVWSATGEYVIKEAVTMYDPAEPYLDRAYRSLTGTKDAPNVGNNPLTSPANWELVWVEDNSNEIDPRLDWSAGRRGIPFWDWGIHTGADWIRDQSYAGPYTSKKAVYKKSQDGIWTDVGNWTGGFNANGYRLIRYADVLLLKAECEAMTNSDDLGMGEVNAVRARASATDGFVKEDGSTTVNAANYVIDVYPASQFASQADAMKAIKFERKLELGLEGHRYYDLQRWGDVQSELNRILTYEKSKPAGILVYGEGTVGAEDVNYPIPQRQIDLSKGNLVQNR